MDVAQVTAAIRQSLDDQGLSPYRAAVDAGLAENAIRTVLIGHEPKAGRLAEICDALGLEFYIGPHRTVPDSGRSADARGAETAGLPPVPLGDLERSTQSLVRLTTDAGGDPIPDDLWPVLARRRMRLAPDLADPAALADTEKVIASHGGEPPEELPSGARPVPVMELAAAAGGGAMIDVEHVSGHVWFRRGWMDQRGIDATRCVVIGVRGESMEPLLPDGCSVLVDRSRTRRRAGRLYAVTTDDGLVAKRARRSDDGAWLLTSDHPAWDDLPWPADAETVGEIRWIARSLG